MTSYDKVLINQGTPILYTELNELQDIINANFKDFSTLLKGAVKGVQDLAYTLASNSITVTGAKVYAVGKVFTLPSTTVSSLFATTSSATGSLYAKITDSVVTGSTDPSIVNNNIGPTASRIKYNIVLAFTTGTIPADITGQAPGSNTWYVPMLSLTGTSTTVPTSDETVYPFTKLNDAQTLGGKSLSGIENDISNARSGGALDAEAWVKQYGLGSTSYPLATGTDLNTVKTNGFYKVNAGVNVPPRVPNDNTAIWHYVIVQTHDSNNWTSQMAIEFNTGTVFVRSSVQGGSSSTVWGPWTQLATTALGTTSGPGILQLTDSVSSTSTTTASTPNSVKTVNDSLTSHTGNTSNPHNTTASQVGAPPIARKVTAGTGLTGGGDLSADRTIALDTTYLGSTSRPGLLQLTDSTSSTSTTTASTPNSVKTVNDSLTSHKNNTSNPHSVTSSQVNKITADSFAGTAGPASFPVGTTVMEVTTATGYPTATGTLITNFLTTDRGFQMFVDKATEVMSIRVSDSTQTNGWGAWKTIVDTSRTATTGQPGIVQLTDSTASTSITTGATPNSVKTVNDSLTSHTGNTSNPHNTTASQVGAPPNARKVSAGTGLTGGGDLSADRTISLDTTYLGSTSRPGLLQLIDSITSTDTTKSATANSVKMALDWVKGFGLGTGGITVTDLNAPTANGYYQGNNMANAPTTDYCSVFHNEWDANTASQLAIRNTDGVVFSRGKGGGTWGAWTQLATTALGTTSAPGLTQLVDSTTSTDTTKAGTANSVRQAVADAQSWVQSFGLGGQTQDISNTDLNNLDVTGFYHGATLTNNPTGNTSDWYTIINMRYSSTYREQLAIRINDGLMFKRVQNNGTWNAWTQFATTDQAQMWKLTQDNGLAQGNSETDMDNFKTVGVWYVGSAVTTNLPSTITGGYADTGFVRVTKPSGNAIHQELIYYGGNLGRSVIFTRTYWIPTATWGSWNQNAAFSDFAKSSSQNGYQKLPSGIIIQWGQTALPTGNVQNQYITCNFPITFPTSCLFAIPQVGGGDVNTNPVVWGQRDPSWTASAMTIRVSLYPTTQSINEGKVTFIAIGY